MTKVIKISIAVSMAIASLQAATAADRDPMNSLAESPMATAPQGAGADPSASPQGIEGLEGGLLIFVKDGKSYIVSGGRMYAQGQKVGKWKIEKISESEVWLRDGKDLTKFQRYAGIQRSTSKQ